LSPIVFALLPAFEKSEDEGIKFTHDTFSWPSSLFRKGFRLDERTHYLAAYPQFAGNRSHTQALLVQGSYFLEASQTLPPACLTLSEDRLAGLMKPFLSFGVSDKGGNAYLV
jgi:hypothetical protein